MKRISFFMVVFLTMVTSAYSQKIKVTSGSLDFLNSVDAFNVEYVYDPAMVVGKMTEQDYIEKKVSEYNAKEAGRGDKWLVSWVADRENRFQPKFKELFNKYAAEKNAPVIDTASNKEYKLIVNTYFTEPGFNVGVMRKNAAISIKAKFVNSNNEEVATMTIINASANNFWGTDFDSGYRLQETYAVAGRELAKFLYKKWK